MTDTPTRQWHRNPVAWLMIAIPAATVVAGFWTLWLAASESGDEAAARLGLSAELAFDDGGVLVQVLPGSGPVAPRLQLVHPIESSLDRELVLSPHPRGWHAAGALVGKEAWHLRLVAADGSWRLVGRYRPGDTALRLEPAVSAE